MIVFLRTFLQVFPFNFYFWFSFSFSLLPFKPILYVAHFLIEALILILMFEVSCVEVHDFIFEFPNWVFGLVLCFLSLVYLSRYIFFLLTKCIFTYSSSLISSWCLRIKAAILIYSSSYSLCRSYFRRSYSICILTLCFFSSSILKMFCWLYLRLAPRTNTLFSGGVASALLILGNANG